MAEILVCGLCTLNIYFSDTLYLQHHTLLNDRARGQAPIYSIAEAKFEVGTLSINALSNARIPRLLAHCVHTLEPPSNPM